MLRKRVRHQVAADERQAAVAVEATPLLAPPCSGSSVLSRSGTISFGGDGEASRKRLILRSAIAGGRATIFRTGRTGHLGSNRFTVSGQRTAPDPLLPGHAVAPVASANVQIGQATTDATSPSYIRLASNALYFVHKRQIVFH